MALSADVKILRYGTPHANDIIAQPIGATVTLYAGSFAVTDGATGKLKNAASTTSGDIVWGLVQRQQLAPATNTLVPIETGTFFMASGTGADQLSQADVGQVVYLIDEVTVGPNAGSKCKAGLLVAVDTTQGSGYAVAVGRAKP